MGEANRDQEACTAVGIDLYLQGGEDALRFAWAAVEVAPMRVVIAEGWENIEQLGDYRTTKIDAIEIEHFDKPITIRPPQGISVFGPEYLEAIEVIGDPDMDQMLDELHAEIEARGTFMAEDGSLCLPTSMTEHEQLQHRFAAAALQVFDRLIPSGIDDPQAAAALTVFGVATTIDYRQRALRRLLYLRALKDQEAFDMALQTACLRLRTGPSELLKQMRELAG